MTLTLEQIAAEFQIVTADIRFLAENEGGRCTSIDLSCDSLYRPHFVVQNRTERQTRINGNECTEQYVAMTLIDGPTNYTNGESGVFRFYCPNWTHADHPNINAGIEFTIREGGKVVAGGTVTDKIEPHPNQTAR